MRRTLLYAVLLGLLAAAAPFAALLFPGATSDAQPQPTPSPLAPTAEIPEIMPPPLPSTPPDTPSQADADLCLYDAALGQTITVSPEEFLIGAAACELPAVWPDQAILAQMVASHSYALSLGDQPMQVNSALCSGWTDAEVLQARWGDEFEERYQHLADLAQTVQSALLCYEGAPAAACYHSISAGKTEASQNVWVTALPYLQGVDSPWDTTVADYEVTITYSTEQVYTMLQSLGLTPDDDPAGWFGAASLDDAGYVASMEIGGSTFSGTTLRSAFSLRSASFTVSYSDGLFSFTTHGYGHGVGLSQYGAKAMAEGGADWQKILLYYFPGCQIEP